MSKLLDQVSDKIGLRHYNYGIEKTYRYVLNKDIGDSKNYVISKRSRKVPTVFSQE